MVGCRRVASGRGHCSPDREGSRSQESLIRRSQQMASDSEKILDDTVEGEKPLGLASGFESAHLPFPLASRLMRGFGAIVGVTFRGVSRVAQDGSHGRRVASEFVGNDTKWFFSLAAQQSSKESLRGALITARLNQDVDHIAVLIHGTPEILLLAIDSNEDFVQVPNIAEAALTPLQFSGIARTELLTPESNRFIRDDDAAFGEKILHISEAQTETMVNPDGIADDFRWETMTVIAGPVVLHRSSVSVRPQVDNAH